MAYLQPRRSGVDNLIRIEPGRFRADPQPASALLLLVAVTCGSVVVYAGWSLAHQLAIWLAN